MRIRVLFFGVLRDAVAGAEQVLELAPGATAGGVLEHYRRSSPAAGGLWSGVAIAINQQYAGPGSPLAEGDEVALLPPVSGGSGPNSNSVSGSTPDSAPDRPQEPARAVGPEDAPAADLEDASALGARAWLTHEPIDTAAILAGIKAGADGAVVAFDGIVRNNTRGRQTLFLDYQGYDAMALAEMRSLARQALERYPVREAVLVHRLGRLAIGESSVLIVVASAHRAAAFDACRWLIDTLKKTVPVWKKEHFVDGAVWVDGEPFPEAIVPTGSKD